MKYLISIMLISISYLCFSQDYYIPSKTETDSIKNYSSPGNCLIQAKNSKMTSYGMAVTSGIFLGVYFNEKSEDAFIYASGAFALLSVVFDIRSSILIGKAGKLMEKEKRSKISFYALPNQAGIRLTF